MPAAPAAWNPCDLPGLASVCGLPGQVTASAFDSIAREFGHAAAGLLDALLKVIDQTTSVDVTAAWFRTNYRMIAEVGLSALLVLVFLHLISAAIQRRPGGLVRAVLGAGTAVLATAILLAVTETALQITDNIAVWIAGGGTDPTRALLSSLYPLVAMPNAGAALLLIGSVLVIVGAFVLWAVLLFRKIAIYLVVVFAPVAFAGLAWEGSRTWARRLLHSLAALILCKIAIVTVFVLGARASAYGDQLSTFLAGVVLLGVACFAPWLTFRFLHFVDLAVAHDHYAMLRGSPVGSPVRTSAGAIDRVQRLAGAARLGSSRAYGAGRGPSTWGPRYGAAGGAGSTAAPNIAAAGGAAAGAAGAAAAAVYTTGKTAWAGKRQVERQMEQAAEATQPPTAAQWPSSPQQPSAGQQPPSATHPPTTAQPAPHRPPDGPDRDRPDGGGTP